MSVAHTPLLRVRDDGGAPPFSDDPTETSFQIGRYEIRGEIGRGTMGVVYEAYDPSLRRGIALKTFHLSFGVSPERYKVFEQRFFAEAQIAARLSHPGIVAVHDVGCDPEIGTLYMALEYLEGRTLQEVIKDRVPLGWREALGITRRVAEALHYAHSQGVVHRDIKPANVMLLPCGAPKILDFGIAKMERTRNLTTACQVFGTPLFMSPEQAMGHKLDGRADLFSLGSIAYTLLTGRLAFEAPSIPATVRRLVMDDPLPPSQVVPDLPPGVDEIIARVLAKSPQNRYACGQALVEDIQTLLEPSASRRGSGAAPPAACLEVALPSTPSAPPVLDLDAELAALVSTPATALDSVPAAAVRSTPRPLRLVLPAVLTVLPVCYLALREPTPTAEGPAGPMSVSPLPQPSAPAAGPSAADDSPNRAPARPEVRASKPNPLPSDKPARLRVDFEHPLSRGTLRLWIDNEMVLQQQLESRESAKIPGWRKGRLNREVAVRPGEHTVRAQVRWDDNDRQQTLSARFESGAARQLDLSLGRIRQNLTAEWK